MVPNHIGIYMSIVLCWIINFGKDRRGTIFCALARYYIIICNCNTTKKKIMSIEFLIVGGVIFAVYVWFTLWIILSQNKKQRKENYPNNVAKKDNTKTD